MIYMMKGSSAALAAAAAGEGALGAKTARACDSCLKRRARWFCGADDAFLCHSCDTLVHSANQLASRHERVRLQTASAKVTTWHSGFTRKARTPRHNKHLNLQQQRLKDQVLFNTNTSSILPLVPELGREEEELEQEQPLVDYDLLCRVPVFNVDDIYNTTTTTTVKNDEDQFEGCDELESFSEFDVDLAEFAANVESLLGVGSSTDHLQVHHHHHEGEKSNNISSLTAGAAGKVKEEYSVFDMTISTDEMFHWNIDDDSSHHQEEKDEYYCEELVVGGGGSNNNNNNKKEERKRERFLRLNYEEVISAWTSSQGCNSSPWTTGNPPPNNNNFTFTIDDDSWPNYLGTNDEEVMNRSLIRGKYLLGSSSGDGGREARVSRYREKRRTRLFAKKIRYEVRKLNAEKRPRMKGRFVKRSNFVGVGVGVGVGGANTTTTTTDHHFPTNYH